MGKASGERKRVRQWRENVNTNSKRRKWSGKVKMGKWREKIKQESGEREEKNKVRNY